MTHNFYTDEELKAFGFKQIGTNVLISKKASIYSPQHIVLGSNIRIDDFCILSGTITLGNYIHIAAYTSLCGGNQGIVLEDFVNLSRKIEIFAISDDFSGASMTNPMIPNAYKKLIEGRVWLKKHVIVGTGTVILPGVVLEEGSAIGALSLVKASTEPWSINAGIPSRKVKDRKRDLLRMEELFHDHKNKR